MVVLGDGKALDGDVAAGGGEAEVLRLLVKGRGFVVTDGEDDARTLLLFGLER